MAPQQSVEAITGTSPPDAEDPMIIEEPPAAPTLASMGETRPPTSALVNASLFSIVPQPGSLLDLDSFVPNPRQCPKLQMAIKQLWGVSNPIVGEGS